MYHFDINIDQFLSLPDEAFEGHEFMVIKPTEKLSSLDEICRDCLEPADDVFEKIPGFGCHQIEKHWLMNNNSDPICKKIQQHFGWTSGLHDISPLKVILLVRVNMCSFSCMMITSLEEQIWLRRSMEMHASLGQERASTSEVIS
uniref:Uncharacterized protein n=1 Tax=Skeletonema marinoi TaxID=267567 RepID=A0A7S2PYX2_9STRA|mmetsp:Transcript_637/g.1006  ORF Transcript_637/g.1006 Transcript_637/m.1006 type:complete len:145 (+) Transcript_637:498-932(+)